MKAISFLGMADYKPTIYEYRGVQCSTRFFSEALPFFFRELEQVLVFVTPAVEQHPNFAELQDRMGGRMKPVRIPDSHSEADLWRIFEKLTGEVAQSDEVIFDITNSFRSLPFLSFLAAAYLRTALQVQVKAVVYGAWEARDTATNVSPVFDLTSFVGLLDWTTATDQFIQTGDARRLAQLLKPGGSGRGAAAEAATTLSQVSLAAFLCQPFPLMQEAANLEKRLRAAEAELVSNARPYATLRDRIVREFGGFGLTSEVDIERLRIELRLIDWYKKNNQLIQAVTLAREWLVSAVTLHLGLPIDLNPNSRTEMERAVSGLGLVGKPIKDEQGTRRMFTIDDLNEHGRLIYTSWSDRDELRKLWGNLSVVRNTLDHAGHQKEPLKISKITSKVDEVLPQLHQLAERWGIQPLTDSASPVP